MVTRWTYDESNKIAKLPNKDLYNLVNSKKGDFAESNFTFLKMFFSYQSTSQRSKAKLKKSFNQYKVKTSIQEVIHTDQENLDPQFWKNDRFSTGVKNIEKRFQELEQFSDNFNFDVFLVIYPWAETLEFGQKKFNWSNFSKKLCSFKRCFLIDAIPAFSRYKLNNENWITDLYFLNDEHFNEKGQNFYLKQSLIKFNEN